VEDKKKYYKATATASAEVLLPFGSRSTRLHRSGGGTIPYIIVMEYISICHYCIIIRCLSMWQGIETFVALTSNK